MSDELSDKPADDAADAAAEPGTPDQETAGDETSGIDAAAEEVESDDRDAPAADDSAAVDGDDDEDGAAVDEASEDAAADDETNDAVAVAGDASSPPVETEPARPSSDHLKPILEALVFASPEPLTVKEAVALLEGEATREEIEAALTLLRHDYERQGGLQLVEVAGGFQIVTRPELHEYVRRLFHERTSQKLSVQALETLAVIAYRQPVTAPEITEIRGVNTSGVLNTLIERKLVKIVGRKAVVGRPFMYATTREFLDKFGLNDISDLPKVEDLADVLGFEPPAIGEAAPAEQALSFDFEPVAELEGPASSSASPAKSKDDETVH